MEAWSVQKTQNQLWISELEGKLTIEKNAGNCEVHKI